MKTLISSEISSSVTTFMAYKTILWTTVLTSLICTCCNTLSLSGSMLHIHFQADWLSAVPSIAWNSTTLVRHTFSVSSSSLSLATQSSRLPTAIRLTKIPSTIASVSSASNPTTLVSSAFPSIKSSTTPTGIPPPPITNVQPLVTLTHPPRSTVLAVSPPSRSCYACPPHKYIDVQSYDVTYKIASFTSMIPDSYSTAGFNYNFSSNLIEREVGYNITITPIPFCSGLSMSICNNPLSGYNSYENLWSAWRDCKLCQYGE